jgi:hypothetical protein
MLGTAVVALSTAQADQRKDRTVKGASLRIHQASTTPVEGYRKMVDEGGVALYVAPKASWTAVDVLTGQTLTSPEGISVQLTMSGEATKQISAATGRGM